MQEVGIPVGIHYTTTLHSSLNYTFVVRVFFSSSFLRQKLAFATFSSLLANYRMIAVRVSTVGINAIKYNTYQSIISPL